LGCTLTLPARYGAFCGHLQPRADEKLTAFLELETAIHEFAMDAMS
jgi:hypothetical protein